MSKKLNTHQLDKELLKAFDQLDKLKEACKVCVSQSTQLPDVNLTNRLIRSSLETMDTCDLCKFFVINRSPMTKQALGFTSKVIKNNMTENNKLCDNKYCKDITNYTYKIGDETIKVLEKIYKGI